jgi:hypothetical protein
MTSIGQGTNLMNYRTALPILFMPLVAALFTAPDANAVVRHATTTIHWTGAQCATVVSPVIGNYSQLTAETVCGAGFHNFTQIVQPGQWIGAKVPLTGQSSVDCVVILDGVTQGVDYAVASQGSGEANCLRMVTS